MLTVEEIDEIRQNGEEEGFERAIKGRLLGGYSKKDVDAYIAGLYERLSKAQAVFEEKTGEYKELIAELNRDKAIMTEKAAHYDALAEKLNTFTGEAGKIKEENAALCRKIEESKIESEKQRAKYLDENKKRLTAEEEIRKLNEVLDIQKNQVENEKQNSAVYKNLADQAGGENEKLKKQLTDNIVNMSAKYSRLSAAYAEEAVNQASVTGHLRTQCADMLKRLDEVSAGLARMAQSAAKDIPLAPKIASESAADVNAGLQKTA